MSPSEMKEGRSAPLLHPSTYEAKSMKHSLKITSHSPKIRNIRVFRKRANTKFETFVKNLSQASKNSKHSLFSKSQKHKIRNIRQKDRPKDQKFDTFAKIEFSPNLENFLTGYVGFGSGGGLEQLENKSQKKWEKKLQKNWSKTAKKTAKNCQKNCFKLLSITKDWP